jgi:hypothetical protein
MSQYLAIPYHGLTQGGFNPTVVNASLTRVELNPTMVNASLTRGTVLV